MRLTAYHEHTHQKRAVINLSKASRLVDDKSMLVSDPTSANPGGKSRRKSAFAEEDEGYAYVEEGFRIRFANGETIDFYADSCAEKDGWMEALTLVVGKADQGGARKAATWTDLVLARERAGETSAKESMASTSTAVDFTKPAQRRTSERRPVTSRQNSKSAPNSPVKGGLPPQQRLPPAPPALAVKRAGTPPMGERAGHRARDAVKSMIF